jgi:PTS system cellobiose-specific IIC component
MSESEAAGRAKKSRSIAAGITRFAEQPIMASIRAGVAAVVPLTIVGGLFMLLANPPIPAAEKLLAPWADLLRIPVAATFGILGLFVCLAVAHDLGGRRGQDPLSSTILAGTSFLVLAVDPATGQLTPEPLGSQGILTAILVGIAAVEVQALLARRGLVIRMPDGVPRIIYESFAALVPLAVLVAGFWCLRFVFGIDLAGIIERLFRPLVFALNTLPGIVTFAFLVTMLWSVGINGDNALDPIVGPVFLQYLAANVEAWERSAPLPYPTALGFFTTFVNVGGTGATLALALVLLNSRNAVHRRISRLSLPAQMFQINEPLFFGLPIVLNPVLMIPYVINAVLLTGVTFLLMEWGLVDRPVVGIPWTTPPVVGHYLATGGDWRAAAWGLVSSALAMAVYWPFARAWERSVRQIVEDPHEAAAPTGRSRYPEQAD